MPIAILTNAEEVPEIPFKSEQSINSMLPLCSKELNSNFRLLRLKQQFFNPGRDLNETTVLTSSFKSQRVVQLNMLHYIALCNDALHVSAMRKRFGITMNEFKDTDNGVYYGEELMITDKTNGDCMILLTLGAAQFSFIACLEAKGVYPFKHMIDMIFPDDPESTQELRTKIEDLDLEEIEDRIEAVKQLLVDQIQA